MHQIIRQDTISEILTVNKNQITHFYVSQPSTSLSNGLGGKIFPKNSSEKNSELFKESGYWALIILHY